MWGHRVRCLVCIAGLSLVALGAQATSHVRIVRLSYVDGAAQMDRANGQGLERAILNSPVVEGSRIVTGSNGLAEVEFEDNTVVRLGEATEIRFSQLLINDAGDKVNEVELLRGTLYFDTRADKTAIDRVIAAGQTFVVRRDSQVRFQMIGDQVQAAVFNGEATLATGSQFVRLKKTDTLTVDANNPAGYIVAKGPDATPLDRWNNERHDYQNAYAYNNYGYGSRGMSAYGYSDLAYYGSFQSLPGWGMAWQPYGASNWLGWDPYSSGAWVLASGGQYAWASAYPWGWMPYHYGSWVYAPAGGWFWVPGKSFSNGGIVTNWQATAPVVKGPAGYTAPSAPSVPIAGPRPTIMVGRIGNAPAYLPDGPVPPNFRSVIQDHSGLVGTSNRSSFGGSTRSYGSSQGSRPTNAARTGSVQNGHVFVVPQTSGMSPSWMNEGNWPSAQQSAGGMHTGTAGSHATTGSTATTGHGGSSATPK